MTNLKTFVSLIALLLTLSCMAQLQPGFDSEEYMEMLRISVQSTTDSAYIALHEAPAQHRMLYQSAPMALDNSWDLWTSPEGTAVISLRGTTFKAESWLENFYAALLPAKGQIILNTNGETWDYELAPDPRAGVHAGWLVGTAFLAKDILPRLDSLQRQGLRDVLIVGHSQGGGIAYLLTAHLHHLRKQGKLPPDTRIKTYCSAGPKPGNLFFAYHYEQLTQNGWAYNVVNPADWVPQVPISIQTIDDFSTTNPFRNADAIIQKQKLKERIMLNHVYNKLDKPTRKAQKNYEKFLGEMTSALVVKHLPGLQTPSFLNSNHYVRTGNYIVLANNEAYWERYPDDSEAIFVHHLHEPYMAALQNTALDGINSAKDEKAASASRLHDIWALERIEGHPAVRDPANPRWPYMELHPREGHLMGFGGCNEFRATLKADEKIIEINEISASRMFCGEENIEPVFLKALQGSFGWELGDNRLWLMKDGKPALVFRKMD